MDQADFSIKEAADKITQWFKTNHRPLPWRESRDPYRIWISEVMLQQTTTTAVRPFYEKFLVLFPNLESLAKASDEEVIQAWAGLGYYNRARNLLRSAKIITQKERFPTTYEELLDLPGFGPYTARSVASLAFDQKVGVLDGNVIRVLSRYLNYRGKWWQTQERRFLQKFSDSLAQSSDPYLLNQGLMELGATLCTPTKPLCLLCPLRHSCLALKDNCQDSLPIKRPKKSSEDWLWRVQIHSRKNKIAIIKNIQKRHLPFLGDSWIFPGTAQPLPASLKNKLGEPSVKHSITHHRIFVHLEFNQKPEDNFLYVSPEEILKRNPSSLIKKIVNQIIQR